LELKHSQKRVINDAFDMNGGTVLDFSNRTFQEFLEDEFGIDIYDDKYANLGNSKANRLRRFIEIEKAKAVALLLRRLWDHRCAVPFYHNKEDTLLLEKRLSELVAKIEAGDTSPNTDAIDRFKADETLDELVSSIERDIAANKPGAAMDRLHTYCMKRFAHLLVLREIECDQSEPLQSRVGKYVKALNKERDLKDVTQQIIKSAIGVFDKFNHVRNNQSLAHDNDLLDPTEARFIFDSISTFLRFVKAIEANQFESR